MRSAIAALAFAAAAVAKPMPQGVTSAITPESSAPAGCSSDYSGSFNIQVVNVSSSSKRDLQRRQLSGTLTMTLSGGVLMDQAGRTGYIAANQQFQFDSPPQTGAVYTAGWSVCGNSSLAIGGDAVFYQCLSGTFYNLYDENESAQCNMVYIEALGSGSSAPATVASDGQPTASPVASQQTDGQVTGSAVASQQSDGQVTGSAVAPVTQISDGQPQASTGAPVSQISDGQPQASVSAAPVSQISDGQPQATTGAPVTQISDGQPQASTGAAVTQISDGQPQAPTGAPVSQISDGQIQASTGANGTIASPTASVQPYTGAAMPTAVRGELFGLAAGVLAVALL